MLATALPSRSAVQDSLHLLSSVGREGKGNEVATTAWKEVVAGGPTALLPVLHSCGSGAAVGDNWLRVAGEAIVDAAGKSGAVLPLNEIEGFVRDVSHSGAGRQLAFDLLQRADAARAAVLEPTLLEDPVQELRRGAVQRLIDDAAKRDDSGKKEGYLKALNAVRDEDQTRLIAGELKKLNVPVDLPKHFGFLMRWQVIGPFSNTERKGFDTSFPPETEIRLDAAYPGKSGDVRWQPFLSTDEYGKIDFNKPLGMQKEVTGYAVTTFESPAERSAELRLGCKDAWKVWLNGQLLFGRDEYHRGQQMDQYKMPCQLRKGSNVVLVKCCQNEEKEEWTVEWEFQLRMCDAAGTAILSAAP